MKFNFYIWDFDGTLFDTYPTMARAAQELLREGGSELDAADIETLMRVSMGNAMRVFRDEYGIGEDFSAEFRRRVAGDSAVKPFPGIPEICRAIVQNGGRNFIFTHRGDSTINFLRKFDLMQYFTECILSDSGFARKPDPAGLLYLIEEYGMNGSEALMIGDRELDILAGKNAGIRSCFFSPGGEGCVAADYSIKSYDELAALAGIDIKEAK